MSPWVDPSPTFPPVPPASGLPFTMSPWGQRLYDRTRPLSQNPETEPDNDYAHAILCELLAVGFRRAADIADPADPHPPLAPLLDPDLCPDWALPWLSSVVGVVLPQGATAAQQRVLIKDIAGWRRGSPASVIAAAQTTLTGSKSVILRERWLGAAWALNVVTIASETPSATATLAAINAAKPAGILVTHTTVAVWDYAALRDDSTTRGENYGQMAAHYVDYLALYGRQRT